MPDGQSLTNPNLPAAPSAPPIRVALALILRDPLPGARSTPRIDSKIDPAGPLNLPLEPMRVLVTQRPVGTICAGAWEFPGGKLEPGETPPAAAAREALEEVGLRVRPEVDLDPVVHAYAHGTVHLSPWVCRLDPPGQTPRNISVAAHKWVTLDEIAQLNFLEANAIIVEKLRGFLQERAR